MKIISAGEVLNYNSKHAQELDSSCYRSLLPYPLLADNKTSGRRAPISPQDAFFFFFFSCRFWGFQVIKKKQNTEHLLHLTLIFEWLKMTFHHILLQRYVLKYSIRNAVLFFICAMWPVIQWGGCSVAWQMKLHRALLHRSHSQTREK